jgi:hypothetical protein
MNDLALDAIEILMRALIEDRPILRTHAADLDQPTKEDGPS